MGQMFDLSCKCGYKKEVSLGEGLMAINLDFIRRIFDPDELTDFENAIANGACDYSFGQRIAYCSSCKDIENVTVLRYVEDGNTNIVCKPCQKCDSEVTLQGELGNCPLCGTKMTMKETGMWD
ncbi:MAG: hypothetical protein LBD23_11545 [Oscillospiraceae bacterium]|jgi:hypothetical protein|nr:hypothetical protein [Oscillospiraceae bacterium]